MKNKHLYSKDWNDVIRPEILKRDNYKCQNCGLKHKSVGYYSTDKKFIECDEFMQKWAKANKYKVQTVSLQIAHLDHNPSNNEPDNLKSLCPRCHLINDKAYNRVKRMMYRGKIGVLK